MKIMIISLFHDQDHFAIKLISLYFTFAKYIQLILVEETANYLWQSLLPCFIQDVC